MAKTFKTIPAPAAAEPAKSISERDFFDLTDEPVAVPAGKQVVSEPDNTDNTSKTDTVKKTKKPVNTGNSNNINNTISPTVELPIVEERDLRQTFVVSSTQLEQLRDYVHARRAQGNYEYSQKQALQEALSMLFASVPQAPPRPSQTRELEQRRRDRIRRGRAV
ncbi:hypothetical protein E4631_23075 [Hymenobacter sp. UV11]|uniref:hypothetical protein n=1 Tax=Hymenobacter sp. UV11 TaxID=1849735 RepID=UPI00105B8DDF|nr:hypothetical protein [Hymenobacter sp. UV11]TDN39627.1 hypothetical protein A8B98_18240 [Hymenobacter sp. UV11]TFZ63375.1 hypothetical protein E4631_23075 [Hymenobacter sp. UV11]